MREIKKIIIHCSDSSFGDTALIDKWHKERGWDGVGYHWTILNGCREKGKYIKADDGVIEPGRPIEVQGAHCKGQNSDSIGICLIGKHHFSPEQLYTSLPFIVRQLMREYGLVVGDVYCHHEFNPGKTCPNIAAETLRATLRGRI